MPFIDPAKYAETPVTELLKAAAAGSIGADRRLVSAIIARDDSADILAYARSNHDDERINIDPLLVDLFRHFETQDALDFFLDMVRRDQGEMPDELVEAILPFGADALEPLLNLYEDVGEEQGHDIAFSLAGLGVRDPRILKLLTERLEYDTLDGALCLSLYGDPAAKPALEVMLAQLPEDDLSLRREVTNALSSLTDEAKPYIADRFDILAEYPARGVPAFDVLDEAERLEACRSTDALIRSSAAHSFFNHEVSPKARAVLLEMAKSDEDSAARGNAWEALADQTETAEIREAMLAVLADHARPVSERGGAAVGLYGVADRDDVKTAFVALYEEGGKSRVKALEAMWRSLWKPYAKYFAPHLDDQDPAIVKEALRGAGYFQITAEAGRIASYFDRPDPFDDLRDDALFAYALAVPGETTRGRIRGLFRKIDQMADLTQEEAELVMFGLDERLRLKGLEPVFESEGEIEEEPEPPAAAPTPAAKTGRNDPCPCGSGKKYKKCHGA